MYSNSASFIAIVCLLRTIRVERVVGHKKAVVGHSRCHHQFVNPDDDR
jgi:hypothetical protein